MRPRHGGNLWALPGRAADAHVEVLDFSADLNPLGPPPGIEPVLREAFGEIGVYPEPTYRALREVLARTEGVHPDQILPGNGTAELIHLVTRGRRAARAAVVVPTFTEYERAILADGGEVVPVHLREEEDFDPRALVDRQPFPTAPLVFLCNPNNPTGRLWPEGRLREQLERLHRVGADVVVDEAYMDFVRDGERYSAVGWIREFPRLMVLRSLTKSFTVPGLRIGYLVAAAQRVEALAQLQPPWPVNGPAALVGRWLAAQRGFVDQCRRELAALRERMGSQLQGLPGVRLFPTDCNFFLCRLSGNGRMAADLAAALAERGIGIRVCDDFTGLEGGCFFRVAVRTQGQNDRLLVALQEAL